MSILLPTTPQPALETNPKVLLLYGAPKVGKSTELLKLPNNLVIDTESGTDYLAGLKIKANDIETFLEILEETRKPNAPKFTYLTVDTIDMLEAWSEVVATKKYKGTVLGKNFMGQSVLELPSGGGYLWLRQSFLRFFDMTLQCSKYVIFTGHIRDKALIAGDKVLQADGTFKAVSNEAVSFRDLDLVGKVKSIVCSRADAIGHMYRNNENKLCVNFATTESVNCGSRCVHLIGKNFEFDWKKIYI